MEFFDPHADPKADFVKAPAAERLVVTGLLKKDSL